MALGGFFWLADTLTPILTHVNVERDAEEILRDMAREVQAYAQQNAPWTDQTGAARNGLTTDVYREGDTVVLQLYHTVDYGVWLETIQNGEYAIIMPTLEHFTGEAMDRCHAVEIGEEGLVMGEQ
jgi:hypothetical protein